MSTTSNANTMSSASSITTAAGASSRSPSPKEHTANAITTTTTTPASTHVKSGTTTPNSTGCRSATPTSSRRDSSPIGNGTGHAYTSRAFNRVRPTDGKTCTLCDKLWHSATNRVYRLAACGHLFHNKCVLKHAKRGIETKGRKPSCPFCGEQLSIAVPGKWSEKMAEAANMEEAAKQMQTAVKKIRERFEKEEGEIVESRKSTASFPAFWEEK